MANIPIPLIGFVIPEFDGCTLPSNLKVLQHLFYKTKILKFGLEESLIIITKEILILWKKARLQTQDFSKCKNKVKNLHSQFRNVQKSLGKIRNKRKEQNFEILLKNVFDISHYRIKNKIQKIGNIDLLHKSISDIADFSTKHDFIFVQAPENKDETDSSTANAVQPEIPYTLRSNTYIPDLPDSATIDESTNMQCSPVNYDLTDLISSSENTPLAESEGSNYNILGRNYNNQQKRGTINVLSKELVTALDVCKISHRNSVRIIAATACSLGHNPADLILNKTSFNNIRDIIRKKSADEIKTLFSESIPTHAVVHWDGKLIHDSVACKQLDRLPILLSSGSFTKLIDVPALENSKGATIAHATHKALLEWGCTNIVQAVCCDTTNSNFGHHGGAAVLLENLLEKDLLYLACRHHMLELILKGVFMAYFPAMNGPDVPIFKRFQNDWNAIKTAEVNDGLENLEPFLLDQKSKIVDFIDYILTKQLPRDDYKELLHLSLLFLGEKRKINLRKPGAMHHARWMSKAIYSLKIYLLRDIFQLTASEKLHFYQICKFIIFVYLKSWYTASSAIKAPYNDLILIKRIFDFEIIDKKISKAALAKFKNHLWYLAPETSTIAFFDEDIPVDIKRKMVMALTAPTNFDEDFEDPPPKKLYCNSLVMIESLREASMDNFITSQSILFFDRFGLNKEFLQKDCESWMTDESYIASRNIVKSLKVVNDSAERAIQLTQEYINISKKEDQRKYLFQVISEYRKDNKDCTKSTILKKLKKD